MRGVCFVHVLFYQQTYVPNGRMAQDFGSPVGIALDLRAFVIVRRSATPSLLVGTRRWAVGRRGAPGPDPYLQSFATCFPLASKQLSLFHRSRPSTWSSITALPSYVIGFFVLFVYFVEFLGYFIFAQTAGSISPISPRMQVAFWGRRFPDRMQPGLRKQARNSPAACGLDMLALQVYRPPSCPHSAFEKH